VKPCSVLGDRDHNGARLEGQHSNANKNGSVEMICISARGKGLCLALAAQGAEAWTLKVEVLTVANLHLPLALFICIV